MCPNTRLDVAVKFFFSFFLLFYDINREFYQQTAFRFELWSHTHPLGSVSCRTLTSTPCTGCHGAQLLTVMQPPLSTLIPPLHPGQGRSLGLDHTEDHFLTSRVCRHTAWEL